MNSFGVHMDMVSIINGQFSNPKTFDIDNETSELDLILLIAE